jgi:uncharacterized membrane protein YqjE
MSAGLLDSARTFVAGVISLGQTRLELFGVEMREEMARLMTALLGGLAALVLAGLGIAFGALAIVIGVAAEHRVAAALLVAGAFVLAAAVAGLVVREALRRKPRAFDASLSELARDYQAIKP